MRIVIYHNVHPDGDGYFGFRDGHPMRRVFSYNRPVSMIGGPSRQALADEAFRLFNADPDMLADAGERARAEQYRARRLRSLSVGDVVQAGDQFLACDPMGWHPVMESEMRVESRGEVSRDG